MKRILFLTMLCLFAWTVLAQEANYRPFIEEGKVWECVQPKTFYNMSAWFRTYYFEGDTVIADRLCKKVMLRSSSTRDSIVTIECVAALYEENRRVWKFTPNSTTPSLLYDFSVQTGDSMYIDGMSCYVAMTPDVNIRGDSLRCIYFLDEWDMHEYGQHSFAYGSQNFWLEGIGATQSPIDRSIHNNGNTENWCLERCSVRDEVIYESGNNPIYLLADIYRDKTPHPFIEEKKEWITASSDGKHYTAIKKFYFGADTIVADIPCKQLMCNAYYIGGKEEVTYEGALFESDRRVYGIAVGDTYPRLLYDFSIRPNDTLSVQRLDSFLSYEDAFRIIPVFRVAHTYDNIEYRAFSIYPIGDHPDSVIIESNADTVYIVNSWDGSNTTWFEGIGSITSPVQNIRLSSDGQYDYLIECSVDGRVIFEQKDEWTEIQEQVFDGLHIMKDQDDSYRPFVEKGKVWETIIVDNLNMMNSQATLKATAIYYFDGDTIVGGKKCTRLMWNFRRAGRTNWITGLIAPVFEEGHRVYFFPKGSTTPVLMYDFDVKAGDTIQVTSPSMEFHYWDGAYSIKAQSTSTLAIRGFSEEMEGGIRQNVLWYEPIPRHYSLYTDFWMKGIGSVSSPVDIGEVYLSFSDVSLLIECRVDSEVLYHTDSYNSFMDRWGFGKDIAYRPFNEEDKVWRTGIKSSDENGGFEHLYEYYFDGYTLYGDKMFWDMKRSEIDEHGQRKDSVTVATLYDLEAKVYYHRPYNTSYTLLYDFFSAVGSKLEINGDTYVITSRNKYTTSKYKGYITGVKRKDSTDDSVTYWFEGVGNTSNPLSNLVGLVSSKATNEVLLSCSVGDEAIYLSEYFMPVEVGGDVKKQWLDFTHTTKPRPKAPRNNVQSAMEEENLTGEYSAKELFVSLKPLTGPYTITLTDAAGNEVYRKEVQTSNVVALNTDLTQYAEGTYSLTVENAAEQYTATLTLPLIDDAVRDLPSSLTLQPSSLPTWTDLSGRRLTTPPAQKGVYIRNSRKVLIK